MIHLITNENGRLDELRPLFLSMAAKGYGKYEYNKYFIIATSSTFTSTTNKQELLLKMLQDFAYKRGYTLNCYCL